MSDRVRIDKWLWAARFFKTRSLAAKAVDGGKVTLNGERAKPAKELKPGDELAIRVAELEEFLNRFRAHKVKARQATSRMKPARWSATAAR